MSRLVPSVIKAYFHNLKLHIKIHKLYLKRAGAKKGMIEANEVGVLVILCTSMFSLGHTSQHVVNLKNVSSVQSCDSITMNLNFHHANQTDVSYVVRIGTMIKKLFKSREKSVSILTFLVRIFRA